ncbi:DUF4199 domain-containing protein [Chitinophaga sp. 22321]|uniref:DUF4199 domain-containing protein n=1 Tax=Chitinophaga hostae TaxID=2831022 RepID=A0ABS5JAV3_9BACT|nr:DUF4199 domain-containing protein [Chitinophaga hostae]MBS0032226.1 DUF4199 domain-containing protein [Chitinophaga hostae]
MQQSSNPGIKWGIVGGIILVFLNVLTYIAGPSVLFSWWNSVIQLAVFIVIAILAGKEKKKQLGGYISFKQALQPVFTAFIIGTAIITVYQFVLYKYIDPTLVDALKQNLLESTEKWMHKFKAPQEEIDKQLDELAKTDFNVGFAKSFMDFLKGIIFYFAVAAIISLIIRKKPAEGQHI